MYTQVHVILICSISVIHCCDGPIVLCSTVVMYLDICIGPNWDVFSTHYYTGVTFCIRQDERQTKKGVQLHAAVLAKLGLVDNTCM